MKTLFYKLKQSELFHGILVAPMIFAIGLFLMAIFGCASKVDHAIYHSPISDKLIEAIIQVESSSRAKAVSEKGAIGLMQVRYAVWHKELKKAGIISTKQCLFDPKKNVRAGIYVLVKYYKQTGDIEKALIKYSGSTRGYVRKIYMEAGR